jgi:hypothetical protein
MDSNQWYGQKIFQKQNPFLIFCNSTMISYFSQKSQPRIFLWKSHKQWTKNNKIWHNILKHKIPTKDLNKRFTTWWRQKKHPTLKLKFQPKCWKLNPRHGHQMKISPNKGVRQLPSHLMVMSGVLTSFFKYN